MAFVFESKFYEDSSKFFKHFDIACNTILYLDILVHFNTGYFEKVYLNIFKFI